MHGRTAGVQAAAGLIGVAGLDFFVDGLVIELGFASEAVRGLLLVEAHEVPETPVTTALFFVGLLAFLVIEVLAHPPGG